MLNMNSVRVNAWSAWFMHSWNQIHFMKSWYKNYITRLETSLIVKLKKSENKNRDKMNDKAINDLQNNDGDKCEWKIDDD